MIVNKRKTKEQIKARRDEVDCRAIGRASFGCLGSSIFSGPATAAVLVPKLSLRVWAVGPLGSSSTGVMLGVK